MRWDTGILLSAHQYRIRQKKHGEHEKKNPGKTDYSDLYSRRDHEYKQLKKAFNRPKELNPGKYKASLERKIVANLTGRQLCFKNLFILVLHLAFIFHIESIEMDLQLCIIPTVFFWKPMSFNFLSNL